MARDQKRQDEKKTNERSEENDNFNESLDDNDTKIVDNSSYETGTVTYIQPLNVPEPGRAESGTLKTDQSVMSQASDQVRVDPEIGQSKNNNTSNENIEHQHDQMESGSSKVNHTVSAEISRTFTYGI